MFFVKLNLFFFIVFNNFLFVLNSIENNDNNVNNKPSSRLLNQKKFKTLKPNIYSQDYDSNTIALEFYEDCLKKKNQTASEMLEKLMIQYECISHKKEHNEIRHHGKIYRKYLHYNHNENDDDICLDDNIINWNDYCIHDISHDIILQLESICVEDITNNIYYGSTKKSDAWNLDMMDGLNNNRYNYPNANMKEKNDNNVDIWILDSGIYSSHNEFSNGQIINHISKISGKHGTNAASIAGGNNYGTSRGFYIHDYIVCGNSASGCAFSDIELALHTIITHMKTNHRRSVINLSVGSSGSNSYIAVESYYESLFQDVIDAGGIIVVSAGNSNQDACNWWFSYSDKVISVGAHESNKNKASYSNYGPCVDIYAPGSYIPAANSISDPTVIGLISGTSFSAPMITGIVANLLYEDNTRTKDDILSLLQTKENNYAIGSCPSGFCYGYYYHCTEPQSSSTVSDVVSAGCCKSSRNTSRLNKFCEDLSVTDCVNDDNSRYCYVDTNCN